MDFTEQIPGSKYFTWHEACYLHRWQTHHVPNEEEQSFIIEQASRLDGVRDFLGCPIIVNCWIRPTFANTENAQYQGNNYNALVGGATNSSHITGEATDFEVQGMDVDSVMAQITPQLENFQLAAENNGSHNGRKWVHLQSRPLLGIQWRVFNP